MGPAPSQRYCCAGTQGGNDDRLLDADKGKPKNEYDGDSFNKNSNYKSWNLQYKEGGGSDITVEKLKHDYLEFLDVWGELADHLEAKGEMVVQHNDTLLTLLSAVLSLARTIADMGTCCADADRDT